MPMTYGDPGLDRAIVDNVAVGWAEITEGLEVTADLLEGRVPHFLTGLPIMMYNGLFDGDLTGPGDVSEIVAYFTALRLPIMWWVSPMADPRLGDWIADYLEEATMKIPGMALDLSAVDVGALKAAGSRPRIVIEDAEGFRSQYFDIFLQGFNLAVGDRSQLQAFADHYFDHPKAEHFIGFVDGEPAGIATVLFHSGVAGVYDVVTLPELRGRGVARAIMSRLLLEARRRGYGVSILHSTAMGHPLYRSLGYEDRFIFRRFLLRPFD